MAPAVSKYETASSRESIIFDFLRQLSARPKMTHVLLRTGYRRNGLLTDERKGLIAKPTVSCLGKGGQGVSITIDLVFTAAHRVNYSCLLCCQNLPIERGRLAMRRKNWRIVIVGFVLIVIALGFYFFMLTIASKSNDPVALMQTVGTVSGAIGGLSLVMIIIGLIGKKG